MAGDESEGENTCAILPDFCVSPRPAPSHLFLLLVLLVLLALAVRKGLKDYLRGLLCNIGYRIFLRLVKGSWSRRLLCIAVCRALLRFPACVVSVGHGHPLSMPDVHGHLFPSPPLAFDSLWGVSLPPRTSPADGG